jgi:hypothetical protein
MKEVISQFFDDYAKRFNEALSGAEPDVENTIASFAPCFVEASPVGIICSKNDERFKDAIPRGYDFYKSIGTQSMKICSQVITVLDDLHAMVKIHWQSLYVKQTGNKEEIGFDVHYFVQVKDEQVKIFAYITGDEKKLLDERGLVPYK